jgi:N-acetylglucosamine-6-phosphate deacetylase
VTVIIQNVTVFTPQGWKPGHSLHIEGERIAEIVPGALQAGGAVVDGAGAYAVPGLIDIHTHGAAGHDTMDATPAALAGMARYAARHGVTGFLPTTITASHEATLAAVANAAAYMAADGRVGPRAGARVLGVHLEGPFLNEAAKGAQPARFCRVPDPAEFDAWCTAGPVRLITVAPELPGAEALIRTATARGVAVSIGHTRATYEQAKAAADWGANQATHTFNAMPGLHHRQPGALGAVLTDDRLIAQIIADGIHLHPAIIALAVRAKTPARVALITDAMSAAGLPNGRYDLGGQGVIMREGACWLAGAGGEPTATLAGSTLTMDVALRNTMAATGLSLAEALPMATGVPAASVGLHDMGRPLEPGHLADIALLDSAGEVRMTIVGGQIVYQRGTGD